MEISTLGEITGIVAQGNADETLWFDVVGGDFVPRFGLKVQLIHDAPDELYRLIRPDGTITEFDHGNGAFLRQISSGGITVAVTEYLANGYNIAKVERSYTAGGQTTTEQLFYEYSNASGDHLLSSVTLRRKVDAGAWGNILKANYTYYGYVDSKGGEEDLKTVTTQSWDGSTWIDTGTTYYRYYPWFVTNGGVQEVSPLNHLLKYVLNPASYARMVAASLDPLTASELTLAQYADNYFEYDNQRRVTKEIVQGGSQTFLMEYAESVFSDGYNRWKTKTIETLPDGCRNIVYCNFAGQTILSVFRAPEPPLTWNTLSLDEWDALTLDEWSEMGVRERQWCIYYRYDDDAHVILQAQPSAVLGYDEAFPDLVNRDPVSGEAQYLKDNDGLIQVNTYHAPSGYIASESLQNGQLGTPIKLGEYEYCCSAVDCECGSTNPPPSTCDGGVWMLSKEIVYPSDTNQTLKIETSHCYSFYDDTTQVKEQVTTLPVVPTNQNGSGVAATRRSYFDIYGNLTWAMDERGYITRMKYDIPTGALVQRIDDVDTAIETDHPTGWTTPGDGGLNLLTDYEHDDRGRITQSLGPSHVIDIGGTAMTIRRATWMNYLESASARTVRTALGYATGTSPSYTYTLVNPVSISIADLANKPQEQIQAARASTSGKLLPSDTFAQSTYTRWTTIQYTDCCHESSRRVYHTIPSSGTGMEGTNYDQTDFGYDVMRRRNRTVSPGGTITRLVFDARGLVTGTWIGTNDDGGTSSDPSGGGQDSDNNMVAVTSSVYDGGADGGDGNLTEQTQHVDTVTTRVTLFVYDWRDRRTDTDGEIDFFQRALYDNLNRVIEVRRYNTSSAGNLIAKSETKHDDRGRIFRTIRYGVNPATGVVGNSLTDNVWHDAAGNPIKNLPAGAKLFTKTTYDGLGRPTARYLGYDLDETSYSDAGSVADDTILEQSESLYDDASNIIETISRQRYHNAAADQTGPLEDPNNDPKARVAYVATYPDPVGRTQATAEYGTSGGTAPTRASTIPTPSDDVLVTLATFDDAGNTLSTTDPTGMVTRMSYDDIGRVIEQIQNYQSSPSGPEEGEEVCGTSDDVNVTVLTSYNADGNVATLTAVNAETGNQVTTYTYGTTLIDSELATSTLKRKEAYPDATGDSDTICFTYNRQSQIATRTDQNGTVHRYDYDLLGRMTQDRVTTLGTEVDGAVRRIGSTFDVRGLREKVTSYDNAAVGNGTVLNEVQSKYNDFGQLITEFQAHGGAVNISTTPKVQYEYADGSENTIRLMLLVYPNGRELTYLYGDTNSMADAASRISAIIDEDDTHLVEYDYLGRRAFVVATDTEPQVKWTLVDLAATNDPVTGDIYSGLDRFGRIKDNRWYNYDVEEDIDRLKYGYDRGSNRLWRENLIAQSLSKQFDELYAYDNIHRLKTMGRGLLNSTHTALTSRTFGQCWALDSTGNWSGMKEAGTGGSWTLEQGRTSNAVNEITNITNSVGSGWPQPTYDAAGNMTSMPQPASPTDTFAVRYDAWNRVANIHDGGDTVAQYQYDGLRRRVSQHSYVDGALSDIHHVYFTGQWQAIEERQNQSSSPQHQFVWGLRYVDDIVLRDRDTDGDGILDERIYAAQDANWNVVATFGVAGTALERFSYTPYGHAQYWSAVYAPNMASLFAWSNLYCGYHLLGNTQLISARHRVMNAALGAWITRDHIDFSYPHLYRYCNCDPLTCTDPYGLESFLCSVVNQEPNKTIASCLCLIIGILDAASKSLRISPQTTFVLNAVDCFCDTVAIFQQGCDCRGFPLVGSLGASLGAMMSCSFDLASMFGPGLDFLDSNLDDFIVQILPIFFSETFTNSPGGAGGGVSACIDILKGNAW